MNKNQSVDLMAPCLKPGKNSLANFVGESLMKFINWQETDKKKKKKSWEEGLGNIEQMRSTLKGEKTSVTSPWSFSSAHFTQHQPAGFKAVVPEAKWPTLTAPFYKVRLGETEGK